MTGFLHQAERVDDLVGFEHLDRRRRERAGGETFREIAEEPVGQRGARAEKLIRINAEIGQIAPERTQPERPFTERAWLNGRVSLAEAEAVSATIAAEGDAELAAARSLASGAVTQAAAGVQDTVAGMLALVEAGIDFTDEEDVVAINAEALAAGVARA
ncbi:MAG: hypothetical protein AAF360_11530, partial [Pseudomonadota bacterium]